MISPSLDEFAVNMIAQRTMALATRVQAGAITGDAVERETAKVVRDAIAHFRSWKHADPEDTRALLVDILRNMSLRVPVSQPQFAQIMVAVSDRLAVGDLRVEEPAPEDDAAGADDADDADDSDDSAGPEDVASPKDPAS
jgi:hypothetical protein